MTSSDISAALSFETFSALLESGRPIIDAELEATWLEGKDLRDAQFFNCSFEPGCDFNAVDFRESSWKDSQFPASTFKSCDLRDAKFENCSFYYADTRAGGCFRHADLSNVEFHNCDLRLTTFPYSQMFCIAFQNSRLTGASLEGCDFGKVAGKRALKTRATFTDCQLNYATLSDLDLEECILTDCDLTSSNLSNTNLTNADLKRSTLSDAETEGLDLTYADLRGTNLGALFLTTLRGYRGMLISASQQHLLLQGLGIKVEPD
ncbi:fluoroquinolone resistance protein [Pseudovibrio ascidiaceicola]|uniref:Fluoroquinolone resistance protein n=1 Tax=Pseudovibrio ascidiaceicola TaxID=285279 RepID=A0A1I3ZQX9_9HYPH|nr:pentapeptide repeat-containing protein [Pseudovibrio ascidiaceicola]SFK46290.1 fluoroquinolone resistance protein [Pseudovibrio ascidiaceicola]